MPFISEHENFKLIPTESFHNQFLEIYYHMGFFSIIIVISLYDLIKKVHENNLINLYLLLIFFLPILFFMTPLSHLYSCTIFIFSLLDNILKRIIYYDIQSGSKYSIVLRTVIIDQSPIQKLNAKKSLSIKA